MLNISKNNSKFFNNNYIYDPESYNVENSTQFFYFGYFLIICYLGVIKFNLFEYIENNIISIINEIKLKKICLFYIFSYISTRNYDEKNLNK